MKLPLSEGWTRTANKCNRVKSIAQKPKKNPPGVNRRAASASKAFTSPDGFRPLAVHRHHVANAAVIVALAGRLDGGRTWLRGDFAIVGPAPPTLPLGHGLRPPPCGGLSRQSVSP